MDLIMPISPAMSLSRSRRSDVNSHYPRMPFSYSRRCETTLPMSVPIPISCSRQPLMVPLEPFDIPPHFSKKRKLELLDAKLQPDWMTSVVVRKPPANLGDLPIELLELIVKHLLPLDLLCLSLCNKWLHASFPEAQFYNFGYDETIFLSFLHRIARSEPRHYICKSCHRLHQVQSVQLPGPLCKPPSCYNAPSQLTIRRWNKKNHYLFLDQPLGLTQFPCYTPYKFYFVHLQLAMRHFLHGPGFGIPVESLSYVEVTTGLIAANASTIHPQLEETRNTDATIQLNTQTSLFSVDARICADPPRFCMRTQELVVVCREKAWKLVPDPFVDSIRICWHINTSGSSDLYIWNTISELVKQYQRAERGKCLIAQGRCQRCSTAWKAQVREIEPNDVSLVITRWTNLGSGLEPEDPLWRSYIESRHYLLSGMRVADPQVQFEVDSVQARSEGALSEDALFWSNSELLRERKSLQLMKRLDERRWSMNPG